MKNKIISILLVVTLGMGCIACGDTKTDTNSTTSNNQATSKETGNETTVVAESSIDESLFQYDELDNGNIAVWGYDDEVEELVIPETIDGKTVEIIGMKTGGGGFCNCSKLKSVVIPDTVRIICKESFINASLKNITLGNGVEEIREYTFGGGILGEGTTIEEITIPASVKYIGEGAFTSIPTLSKVIFLGDVETIKPSFVGSSKELTIYGPANSNVHTFAEESEYNFVAQ